MTDMNANGGETTERRPGETGTWLGTTLQLLLLGAVVFAGVAGGLWARDKTWTSTYAIRFQHDINNGFNWGKEANGDGYFSVYERLGEPDRDRRRIDYAPLRLGLMTYWVSGMRETHEAPLPSDRSQSLAFHRPLLAFNTLIGLAASVGAFLVARHVSRWSRCDSASPLGFWPGTWVGVLVGLLVWFNPLILLNAHGWPQWDVWPMPFFFFALYACLRKWWLVAGVLLGIGATLKGQILMVAWVLPLFAILIGDWRGALRIAIGVVTGIMLIGLPWVVTRWDPQHEPTRVFDLFDRNINWLGAGFILAQIVIAAVVPVVLFKRVWPTAIAFAYASGAWLSMTHFGGTSYWLQSSFGVGTWNYPAMYMGTTSNLGALLHAFGWRELSEHLFDLPRITLATFATRDGPWEIGIGGYAITMRTLLLMVFITLCLVCAAAAAVRYRQRDARAVIALCLPWLLFYSIPGQIHERYLLYIAACAPLFLIAGGGWFMLGCVFVLLGFVSTIHTAIRSNHIELAQWSDVPSLPWSNVPVELWGFARYLVEPTHPGIAWGLLMGVAVAIFGLWTPRRGGDVHELG